MDPRLLRLFQEQILLQCRYVLFARGEITQTMNDLIAAPNFEAPTRVFYSIQNLLSAAANIAKAFWGPRKRPDIMAYRKPVRDSVGISDDSELREIDVRNHFEHIDEKLTDWWDDSANHSYIDLNIASKNAFGAAWPTTSYFRNFDPDSMVVSFWEHSINLRALLIEVEKIMPILIEITSKPLSSPAAE